MMGAFNGRAGSTALPGAFHSFARSSAGGQGAVSFAGTAASAAVRRRRGRRRLLFARLPCLVRLLGRAAPAPWRCPRLARSRPAHGVSDLITVRRRAQHSQRGGPMVRRVGMQLDPAILRLVIASHGIPGRRYLPPLRADGPAKPQGSEPAVNRRAGLPAILCRNKLRHRKAGCADRSTGQVGHREGRRQIPLSSDLQLRQPFRRTAQGGPNGGNGVSGDLEHATLA